MTTSIKHIKFSTEKFDVIFLEKGIIENVIKTGTILEKKDIHELKKLNLKMANGEKYTVLVSPEHLSSITKEARELVACEPFAKTNKAKALLITNLGHSILANFYLQINKPATLTKIFSDRESALMWLRWQLQII